MSDLEKVKKFFENAANQCEKLDISIKNNSDSVKKIAKDFGANLDFFRSTPLASTPEAADAEYKTNALSDIESIIKEFIKRLSQ